MGKIGKEYYNSKEAMDRIMNSGRKIENANDDDLVVLIINEEKIYLKKVYG